MRCLAEIVFSFLHTTRLPLFWITSCGFSQCTYRGSGATIWRCLYFKCTVHIQKNIVLDEAKAFCWIEPVLGACNFENEFVS